MSNNLLNLLPSLLIILVVIVVYMIKNEFLVIPNMYFRYNSYYRDGYYNNLINNIQDAPFRITKIHNKSDNDKIFTVSIYGNNPKYINGLRRLITNSIDSSLDWTLRVYCHDQADPNLIQELINNPKIETYIVDDPIVVPGNSAGMFWRFMPLSEDITFMTLDVDEDNRMLKDPEALTKWLKSNKGFFRFGNTVFPWAKTHLCGKYFGRKKGYSKVDPKIITHYPLRSPFGADEIFEQQVAGPLVQKDGVMTYIPKSLLRKIMFQLSPSKSTFGKYNKYIDEIIY